MLQLSEVPIPEPASTEVSIQVKANSINAADWRILRGEPALIRLGVGWPRPKKQFLGADFAGVVSQVGDDVRRFKVGDRVFGESKDTRAFGSFICVPEDECALMPHKSSFEEMACVPLAGLTAFQALVKHAKLQKGESVLVNGASGGVGHFVVQIVKTLGATVTAVCSSRKANFVKECGADKVIAYDKERMAEHSGAYDIVIDVHGNFKHSDFRRLGRKGVVIGFTSMWHMFKLMMKKSVHPFPLVQFSAKPNPDDLASLAKMIEEGSLQPRIDRIYDHHQLAEAIAHVEGMQTLGKVALRWNI